MPGTLRIMTSFAHLGSHFRLSKCLRSHHPLMSSQCRDLSEPTDSHRTATRRQLALRLRKSPRPRRLDARSCQHQMSIEALKLLSGLSWKSMVQSNAKGQPTPAWIYTQEDGQCWAASALLPDHGAPWEAVLRCVEDVNTLEPVYPQ